MRGIRIKRKGFTLIEVIISLAILAILIVPMSNMIVVSVKTNKEGEDKQQSAYLSQQVLEGIKSTSSLNNVQIVLNKDSLHPLTVNADGIERSVTINDYLIKVKATEQNYITFDTQQGFDATLVIGTDDDKEIGLTYSNDSQIKRTTTSTNISVILNDKSLIVQQSDGTQLMSKTVTDGTLKLDSIDIKFYSKSNFTIDIYNNRSTTAKIYGEAPSNREGSNVTLGCYTMNNKNGTLTIYNVNPISKKLVPKNYDIDINIEKNGKNIYHMASNIMKEIAQ